MIVRRHLGFVSLLALLGLSVAVAHGVTGLETGLLHLAPALLLALPLLVGRYVGEERLAVLGLRRVERASRAVVLLEARLPRAPRATMARGGALLASALAQRGPPAALPTVR